MVPGRRSIPAITAAPSAICGTHFGETNDADSTFCKPAFASRFTSSIFTSVATNSFSFCRPSRGPTSTIFTLAGSMVVSLECVFVFAVLVTPFHIDYAGYRLAARKRHDLVRDLLRAFLAQRFSGDMRRDREARRAPERMIVRQRFGVEYIECRGGDLTGLHGVEQIVVDQMPAAREVDEIRARRQPFKRAPVQDAFGVRRMRQQVDEHSRAVEEGLELFVAGESLDAFNIPLGTAKTAYRHAERRQRLRDPCAENAHAQHADREVLQRIGR